jgi:hypothetical protein
MGAGADPCLPGQVTPREREEPGWAKLAAAVAADVPPAEIETIYLFRPIKREGREWGTAVVTRRAPPPEGRLRVYTAKYMLVVRGKERGQARVAVEEVGSSPADVLEQVMRSTAERTGDTEPPVAHGPAVWYEG